jgi:hypothetical protein
MKWWLIFVAACGSSSAKEEPPAPVVAPYVADIDNLCNVIERSGSKDLEANDKRYKTATWLAANLKTPEGHKFLETIQPLDRNAKIAALEGEAKRVGLAGCPLAASWRSANH